MKTPSFHPSRIAAILLAVLGPHSLQQVEHRCICTISNRMNAQLEAVIDSELRCLLDGVDRSRVEPDRLRIVGVWLKQPGAPGAERARESLVAVRRQLW